MNLAIAAGKTSATLDSTNCLVNGLTGMDAIGVFPGGWAGTLVANGTLGIVQIAAHVAGNIAIGADIAFGGNTYHAADIQTLSGTDIGFVQLDAKVTGVNPMKVLPFGDAAFDGTMEGLPAVWVVARSTRIQLMEVRTNGEDVDAGKTIVVRVPADPRLDIGTTLITGDSSSPLVTIINGEVVLLSTAYEPTVGSNIIDYHPRCEQLWIDQFGITDAYTEIDISTFDAYDAAPEAIAITLEDLGTTLAVTCAAGSLGTVYGQVLLRRRFRMAGKRRVLTRQARRPRNLHRSTHRILRLPGGEQSVHHIRGTTNDR